jgi:hypothetical protein
MFMGGSKTSLFWRWQRLDLYSAALGRGDLAASFVITSPAWAPPLGQAAFDRAGILRQASAAVATRARDLLGTPQMHPQECTIKAGIKH